MLNPKMEKALNEQVNAEMFSAYLYLSMSAYFESKNLAGFANWMKVQANEELTHAMKFYTFINERGGRVELMAIEKPKSDFEGPVAVVEETLTHERHVTSLIHKLVEMSIELKDYATQNMLQWFISEQVEEESNVSLLLERLKMVASSPQGMFIIDNELKQRVFIDDTAE